VGIAISIVLSKESVNEINYRTRTQFKTWATDYAYGVVTLLLSVLVVEFAPTLQGRD
jgi:hypothetical protein